MLLSWIFVVTDAQQPAVQPPAIDNDDIGGVVTGPNGPEAGVWVIAETRDLPVRYIKSVVTDDQGRYVVPDLPKANYSVWVRGYGLVDSPKVTSAPGRQVNHTASQAPSEAAAAHYYPAIYWYSMLKIPGADEFGGKTSIPARLTQSDWLNQMKNNGCVGCHQLGQLSTRTIPAALGTFASHEEAWKRRVQSGQSGQQMLGQLSALGPSSFKLLGEWTERVAKGELPFAKPPRPQGAERNIVVTVRDWMDDKHYLHDLIASDKRYPTVNAYGPVYGSPEYSSDNIPTLDPIKNTTTIFRAPVRDEDTPLGLGPGHAAALDILQPSPYWGEEVIWNTKVNNHNSMLDQARGGCGWLRRCAAPTTLRSARRARITRRRSCTPVDRSMRHVSVWDPKTNKYQFVDTCFNTHHPQFGFDANDTLWTSGGGPVVGWVNTKMFLATGDSAKSQGWTALILDTNGNGKRDEYVAARSAGRSHEGQARHGRLLRRDAASDGRIDLGFVSRQPRCSRAPCARTEPASHYAGRDLQRAEARLRRPWRRHRQAGRRVGFARQRAHRRLRSP